MQIPNSVYCHRDNYTPEIMPCDDIKKFYSKDDANDRLFYTVTHIFCDTVYSLHGIFTSEDNALESIQRTKIKYPNSEFKVECSFINKIR